MTPGERMPVASRGAAMAREALRCGPRQRGVTALATAVAAAMAAPVAGHAAACGETLDAKARRVIEAQDVTLAWAARPVAIPLDRHFALDIVVCGAPVTALRVDADMPAHRHGMNYRTTVAATGAGRYAAQGLMFHMPGRWRLIFDVDTAAGTRRLTQEIDVR